MTLALHIGLPKTASTYLQKHVFPSFLKRHQYAFGEEAKSILRSGCIPKHPIVLLSAEAWANSLWGNGYLDNFHKFKSQTKNLKRDDIKILFFIRDHEEWLISAYLQLAKAALFRPRTFSKYLTKFDEADLSWSRRISDLQDYPVFVCRYEEFVRNPSIWTNKIAQFIGLEGYEYAPLIDAPSQINLTPKTALSLALVRSITVGTEVPDMAFKKFVGRRLLFVKNSRADFLRVWVRDKLIRAGDCIPGLLPIKHRYRHQIPASMRDHFREDINACRRYISGQ